MESKPEPEPVLEPVIEEESVEPISMSSRSKVEEPIQMDSPAPIIPEVVGNEPNSSKKKWIIIAVVVAVLLCCCCLIVAVAMSWEGIYDAIEDIMFQVGPALAQLQTLIA